MTWQGPFSQHDKLLRSIGRRVHRRVFAAGARTVQFDDIYQELAIAWCKARDHWDESHGVPFGPYLMTGMKHHINRWVDRELREFKIAPKSFDEDFGGEGGDEGVSLHDSVADGSDPLDEQIITKDMRDFARDPIRWRQRGKRHATELLPETKRFLELMESPPPQIVQMMRGIQQRALYGRRKLGIPGTFAPAKITSRLVFDVMGIDAPSRKAVMGELRQLYAQVEAQ